MHEGDAQSGRCHSGSGHLDGLCVLNRSDRSEVIVTMIIRPVALMDLENEMQKRLVAARSVSCDVVGRASGGSQAFNF